MGWICYSTWTSISLTQEEILHYRGLIKEVWPMLLNRDKQAMQKVDQVLSNSKAIELRTPRFSRLDAQAVPEYTANCQALESSAHSASKIVGQFWRELCFIECVAPSLFKLYNTGSGLGHRCQARDDGGPVAT